MGFLMFLRFLWPCVKIGEFVDIECAQVNGGDLDANYHDQDFKVMLDESLKYPGTCGVIHYHETGSKYHVKLADNTHERSFMSKTIIFYVLKHPTDVYTCAMSSFGYCSSSSLCFLVPSQGWETT